MPRRLLIADTEFNEEDPGFQTALQGAHGRKIRPKCLCQVPPPEMYIALIGQTYFPKRFPGTGHLHATSCPSYAPPIMLSGLGDVLGQAIIEDETNGSKLVKVQFSLSRGGSRTNPPSAGNPPETASTDGKKLTIRALLHMLWEEAELSRWVPGFDGRRSWMVVRRLLTMAARNVQLRGRPLTDLLFIPETFDSARKSEIEAHVVNQMAPATFHNKKQQYLILIGEIKELREARGSHKAIIKHLPNTPFGMPNDLHRRLLSRFADAFAIWSASEGNHLIMIATFGISHGIPEIVEAAVMVTSPEWLPIQNAITGTLASRLVAERRRFQMALAYNLTDKTPIASAILEDTNPPTALFIVPPTADDKYQSDLEELILESTLPTWIWNVPRGVTPELPAPARAQEQ